MSYLLIAIVTLTPPVAVFAAFTFYYALMTKSSWDRLVSIATFFVVLLLYFVLLLFATELDQATDGILTQVNTLERILGGER